MRSLDFYRIVIKLASTFSNLIPIFTLFMMRCDFSSSRIIFLRY